MKQRITMEQLNQLTDEQKDCLREWWNPGLGDCYIEIGHDGEKECPMFCVIDRQSISPSHYALPLLSIGQLIEYLHENLEAPIYIHTNGAEYNIFFDDRSVEDWTPHTTRPELCDALWAIMTGCL